MSLRSFLGALKSARVPRGLKRKKNRRAYLQNAVASVVEALESRTLLSFTIPLGYQFIEQDTVSMDGTTKHSRHVLTSGVSYYIVARGLGSLGPFLGDTNGGDWSDGWQTNSESTGLRYGVSLDGASPSWSGGHDTHSGYG